MKPLNKDKVTVNMLLGLNKYTHMNVLLDILTLMQMDKRSTSTFTLNEIKLNIKPKDGLTIAEAIKTLLSEGFVVKTDIDKTYEVINHPWH
ncbi:MAG: hypothetical protein ACRDD8_09685 [Bacteroidales bacterium]